MPNESVASFLLVEDEENDILLLQRAFAKAHIVNSLHVVRSGEEAISYLAGDARYSNRTQYPLPAVVLLDLKLRGVNGFEVLKWIRAQPLLQGIRVVVLTASDSIRDANQAYQLGANSFLIKPMEVERFVEIACALGGHWRWCDTPPALAPAAIASSGVSTEKPNRTGRFIGEKARTARSLATTAKA